MKKMKNQATPLMKLSTSVFLVCHGKVRTVLPLSHDDSKENEGEDAHDDPVRESVDVL